MKRILTTAAALAMTTTAAFADSPVVVKAVGTWGSLTNYQKHEGPFWNKHIAEALSLIHI